MTDQAYLQDFVKDCSEAAAEGTGEKFAGWEGLVAILVYEGMKLMQPELKEWVKLRATVITLKRRELRNRLVDYARKKELDLPQAEKAAEVVASRVNEENLTEDHRWIG